MQGSAVPITVHPTTVSGASVAGENRLQRRRLCHRRPPLRDPPIRPAPHRHFAVAPRLVSNPLDAIVAVLLVREEAAAIVAAVAASLLAHEGITLAVPLGCGAAQPTGAVASGADNGDGAVAGYPNGSLEFNPVAHCDSHTPGIH